MNARTTIAAEPDPGVTGEGRLLASHQEFRALVQERVGSRALAEGLLHDAFVRDDELDADPGETVVAWFMRVLRGAVIDYQQRHEVTTRGLRDLAVELGERSGEALEFRRVLLVSLARLGENLHPRLARTLQRIEFNGPGTLDSAAGVLMARQALKRQVVLSCMTPLDSSRPRSPIACAPETPTLITG